MTGAARAGIALAAASLFLYLGATGTALARSKHHHHEHKSRHHHHHHSGDDGGSLSEGKAHLKSANALAGDGDCAAAIAEYTKAFELLNDPVVLFNRAECYRRIDENEKAADDYHAFLEKVPTAPNRAAIEKKLLAIEAPEPSQSEKPAVTTPPPPAKVTEAPPLKAPPKVAEPPPPKAPPPKVAEGPPPKIAEAPPPKSESKPEPVVTVRQPESKPEPVVIVQQPAAREEAGQSSGSRPWVWVALTVLAVGAGVAGYLVFRPHQQPPPDTQLGNYRF